MIGRRLAQSGYSVLVVNPFYRIKRQPLLPDFDNPVTRPSVRTYNQQAAEKAWSRLLALFKKALV